VLQAIRSSLQQTTQFPSRHNPAWPSVPGGPADLPLVDPQPGKQLAQLQAAGNGADLPGEGQRDRPELTAMLDYVREGNCVVCCKLDRIAWSTRHLLEIVEAFGAEGGSLPGPEHKPEYRHPDHRRLQGAQSRPTGNNRTGHGVTVSRDDS